MFFSGVYRNWEQLFTQLRQLLSRSSFFWSDTVFSLVFSPSPSPLDDETARITVSASSQIILAGSQLSPPTCEDGKVLVREIGSCSAKNVIKVEGIRL